MLEFPDCPRFHQNENGEHICGEQSKKAGETCGIYGMCWIQGYDGLEEGCPIGDFLAVYKEESEESMALTRNGPIKVLGPKKAGAAVCNGQLTLALDGQLTLEL